MMNKKLINRTNDKKKRFLQHGVFVFGHPPKYYPHRTGRNFVEQTKHVAVHGKNEL